MSQRQQLRDDDIHDEDSKVTSKQQISPEYQANFISRLTFWWFNSIVMKGFKKPLDIEDIYAMPHADTAQELHTYFSKTWNEEKNSRDNDANKISLLRALTRAFGLRVLFGWFLIFLSTQSLVYTIYCFFANSLSFLFLVGYVCDLVSPILLARIISYTTSTNAPWYEGLAYAAALWFVQLGSMMFFHHFFHVVMVHAMRVRFAFFQTIC